MKVLKLSQIKVTKISSFCAQIIKISLRLLKMILKVAIHHQNRPKHLLTSRLRLLTLPQNL